MSENALVLNDVDWNSAGTIIRLVIIAFTGISVVGFAILMSKEFSQMAGLGQQARYVSLLFALMVLASAAVRGIDSKVPINIVTWMMFAAAVSAMIALVLTWRDMRRGVVQVNVQKPIITSPKSTEAKIEEARHE